MNITFAKCEDELSRVFEVLSALRPHLSLEEFLARVKRMQAEIAYQLVYLEDDGVKSVAGFRISEWLHTGKYLEIEDLVTKEGERSKAYGDKIFDWVLNYARENNCRQVRLVSGVARQDAHRFYLRKGMSFEAKYFSINID